MRRRGIPESRSTHPNVTPLIDVVMCLIIFYMLVAKIGVARGVDAAITLPESVQGLELKDLGNTMILNVDERGGEPLVTALVPKRGNAGEEWRDIRIVDSTTGKHDLRDVLMWRRYGNDLKPGGRGGNADNENFKIIIRGDAKNLTYKSLEPVLIACMEANVKDVNFSTNKP
jgi:biopolymer transport protein ExbD